MTEEEVLDRLRIGMSREQVKQAVGEPSHTDWQSKRHPEARVWRYGELELHFESPRWGRLWMIYAEEDNRDIRVRIRA